MGEDHQHNYVSCTMLLISRVKRVKYLLHLEILLLFFSFEWFPSTNILRMYHAMLFCLYLKYGVRLNKVSTKVSNL